MNGCNDTHFLESMVRRPELWIGSRHGFMPSACHTRRNPSGVLATSKPLSIHLPLDEIVKNLYKLIILPDQDSTVLLHASHDLIPVHFKISNAHGVGCLISNEVVR